MKLQSSHDLNTYLYELRQSLGSATDFGIERFTGIVFGRFFCITHHCDRHWNRKITAELNTAIGYVRKADNSTVITFITTKGSFRPQFLIPWILFSLLILKFLDFSAGANLIIYGLIGAIISAICDSLTQAGKDGHKSLISLLNNPQNPYENL